jgi:lathosterol oxidase
MVAPMELIMMNGYGQIYHNIDDYGWAYLFLSPILFLIFTDGFIYAIHRALHWGPLYKVHKLHHRFKETTPFSAFAFHPLDGWLQGSTSPHICLDGQQMSDFDISCNRRTISFICISIPNA